MVELQTFEFEQEEKNNSNLCCCFSSRPSSSPTDRPKSSLKKRALLFAARGALGNAQREDFLSDCFFFDDDTAVALSATSDHSLRAWRSRREEWAGFRWIDDVRSPW